MAGLTTASSCATAQLALMWTRRCLHQRGSTTDGRNTLICSRQSRLVVQSCVSSCRRCVFSMNAFAFFATNFTSHHFLFSSWTDLLTGNMALMASVTSLRCTCPRHAAADKENQMIFSDLLFTQNYFAVCVGKVFLPFPILFVRRLTGCTTPWQSSRPVIYVTRHVILRPTVI